VADSSADGIDIITVPDFSTGHHRFEARTLFFLGSWIDCGPKRFPCMLHLACVGQPPESVRILAQRAGATLSFHDPVPWGEGGYVNKLRGLEIVPRFRRFLLLDTDILFWADPTAILKLGECIAASAAARPKIPAQSWPEIFAAVGLPMPQERISSRFHRIGLPQPEEPGLEPADQMVPYFNAGVIYGPWAVGLGEKWSRHCEIIYKAFRADPDVARSILDGDQVGLATSVHELRTKIRFRFLPDSYNATRPVLAEGALSLTDAVLFHAVGFLRGAETRASILQATREYEKLITHFLRRRPNPSKRSELGTAATPPRRFEEAAQFRHRLRRLCRNYVEPFLPPDG
jgi:hypothetical protein